MPIKIVLSQPTAWTKPILTRVLEYYVTNVDKPVPELRKMLKTEVLEPMKDDVWLRRKYHNIIKSEFKNDLEAGTIDLGQGLAREMEATAATVQKLVPEASPLSPPEKLQPVSSSSTGSELPSDMSAFWEEQEEKGENA